jgi:uncharacterized membrane protein YjjP (DUF1212 family)
MNKNSYDKIMNVLFIGLVGLTFLNLYKNMIWLSYVLTAAFLLFTALHIRDYRTNKPTSKKIFVLALVVLINFLLANAVIVLAEYVYPY